MYRAILFVLLPLFVFAKNPQFSTVERLQGYKQDKAFAFFIFDEAVYGVSPSRIFLEGSMRGWDHSLTDPGWWLKKSGQPGLWVLRIKNENMTTIPPGSLFKFRVNEGEWLNPPADAPNEKGGNLVFAHDQKALRLEAEVHGPRDVRLIFKEARPPFKYSTENYRLTTASGENIDVARVFYTAPGQLQIVPAADLNIKRLHYLEIKYLNKKIPVTYDGWFRHLYSDKDLGANYYPAENATWIRLFAPRADSVFVYLYLQPGDSAASKTAMVCDTQGVWETRLQGNWNGWYYDFTAHGPDEAGNRFYESNPVHFSDPWGRVSVDTFGPCRIWPETQPATPLKKGIPAMEDVIAYEVHVQDFTRYLPLPDQLKGTFSGFAKSGLRNKQGQKIGIDHLSELGINVVHLMPVQEYLHFPDNEWQEAFGDDHYMTAQGINNENYQWGYRTSHAFALESRYREKGSEWGAQNEQFRDLVQKFHDRDIAVIVDVVFNHTAERMDNRQYYFNFSAIDVPYFYRTNEELDFLGEYGTETKSEERPLMQRWIIEQCTDLIAQYGIDGFRIDIAGQTDEQTLLALREALGPDVIVYGEPWIASQDPDYENNPDWDWYKIDSPITFFQDDSRNAFKGPTSNPKNKETDRGYAGGNGKREKVKKALAAAFPEDHTPLSGINYLDIHDNWALADRFAQKNWDGRFGVDENRYKIAATLLFSSLGPIVLHGGSELMRSKGLAPLEEQVKYTSTGPIYLHGKRDSYNLALANAFIWENKGLNISDAPGIHCNYKNMYEFWKGLIEFRKSKYGKVFRLSQKPAENYYQWIEPQNTKLLGYIVDEKVLVLINTDQQAAVFGEVILPEGKWEQIADINRVDVRNGIQGEGNSLLEGGKTHKLKINGSELKIWINTNQ